MKQPGNCISAGLGHRLCSCLSHTRKLLEQPSFAVRTSKRAGLPDSSSSYFVLFLLLIVATNTGKQSMKIHLPRMWGFSVSPVRDTKGFLFKNSTVSIVGNSVSSQSEDLEQWCCWLVEGFQHPPALQVGLDQPF